MAYSQGYGKTITTGSVFAYDTADSYNCFKGKPTTNLLTQIYYEQGTVNETYFKTSYGTETAYIPGLGGNRAVTYCNIYNDYVGGSTRCCPALFNFGGFSVSPSTEYSYQIIYRNETGYSSANYMYHYEYNGGTYVTEYGLLDASRQEDLGGGWKHAWGTFTSNASTNFFYTYLFHYEYLTYNKVQIAGVMLTQGSQVLRPSQFLPINTTRSTQQSLYDLVDRTSLLNLNSVSFDASGSLFFDGTDDNITTGVNTLGSRATYEAVIKCLADVSSYNMFMGTFLPYIGVYNGTRIIFSDNIGGLQSTIYSPENSIVLNNWYHVVCVRTYDETNSTNYIYINGVQVASGTFSGANYNYGTYLNIGDGQTDNWYPFRGYIPVAKAYNRSLTEKEIQTNYKTYKARFKLS
jgi:hypothetical protein